MLEDSQVDGGMADRLLIISPPRAARAHLVAAFPVAEEATTHGVRIQSETGAAVASEARAKMGRPAQSPDSVVRGTSFRRQPRSLVVAAEEEAAYLPDIVVECGIASQVAVEAAAAGRFTSARLASWSPAGLKQTAAAARVPMAATVAVVRE